jgi:hypothetical protein
MASAVDITNLALTLLGQEPIADVGDENAAARAINTNFNLVRDSELAVRHWRFSTKRVSLASLVPAPIGNDYSVQFQLPVDFLSPIRFGDYWPGQDVTDYRTSPTADYSIEGDKLLCNFASPLLCVYCAKITNTELFHPCFNMSLAAMLAFVCCEKITGSASKQEAATRAYKDAMNRAMLANAILSPPSFRADNSWVMARVNG